MMKSGTNEVLKEMKVKADCKTLGIANDPAGMGAIGALWGQFFQTYGGVKPIIAIYTNYQADNTGKYDFYIGTVEDDAADDVTLMTSAGTYYAVDISVDDPSQLQAEIGGAWGAIWANSELKRTYVADFELYKSPTEVTIYVGVAE